MSRKPAYPEDAPVAPPPAVAAAEAAESHEAGPAAAGDRRRKQIMTGAAIGIGSAAIVAALLYANRHRRGS
jgi:hypothetical protein